MRRVAHADLASMLRRHEGCSSVAHLRDRPAIARARTLAEQNGVWDELSELDPRSAIPVVRRSEYRNFARTGDRSVPEAAAARLADRLDLAALAVWLDHPASNVDYLQDLLWAACDEWTWVMAAHEGRAIDLGSAGRAARYAEIVTVFDERIEDEVADRVRDEVDRRVLQPFRDTTKPEEWKTCRHNWNHVCNGAIIRAALLLIDDPDVLAHTIHPAIVDMTYAIDGFTEDGGCVEGPGYWNYGFGNYLQAAHALFERTGGELNIMEQPKLERISRYPLAAWIDGPLRATFADSGHGYTDALAAILVNRFVDLPEIYGLCELLPDRTLKVREMHELALYDGRPVDIVPDRHDCYLPDLGQAKLRGEPGEGQMTLLVKAGNNGVNHSHNDVGSFIVHRGGRIQLVDPGAPVYTAKTFSAQRYEIVFCNSYGHSVPVVNGTLQSAGDEYYGTLTVEDGPGADSRRAVVDMTHAYPAGTVGRLVRTFTLHAHDNRLELVDEYTFDAAPSSVEEAFITFEDATVDDEGGAVTIGSGREGVRVTAGQAGTFSVKRLEDESKEGRAGRVIARISFVPRDLSRTMRLAFQIA